MVTLFVVAGGGLFVLRIFGGDFDHAMAEEAIGLGAKASDHEDIFEDNGAGISGDVHDDASGAGQDELEDIADFRIEFETGGGEAFDIAEEAGVVDQFVGGEFPVVEATDDGHSDVEECKDDKDGEVEVAGRADLEAANPLFEGAEEDELLVEEDQSQNDRHNKDEGGEGGGAWEVEGENSHIDGHGHQESRASNIVPAWCEDGTQAAEKRYQRNRPQENHLGPGSNDNHV